MTRLNSNSVAAPVPNSLTRMPKHLPTLDGLRGFAILAVMCFHFLPQVSESPRSYAWFAKAVKTGWTGVDLFFVLSGFLITGILLESKTSPHYFRNFYMRRSLRIFPLYYGLLILLIFLVPWLGWPSKASENAITHQKWLWLYGANLFIVVQQSWGLGNLEHLWSLAVEEHFYLVWPLVVRLCAPRRLIGVCLGMIGLAVLLRAACHLRGLHHDTAYVFTLCRCDSLCLGALLAIGMRTENGVRAIKQMLVPAAVVSASVVLAVFFIQKGSYRSHWFWEVPGYSFIGVACAGLLYSSLPVATGWIPGMVQAVCSQAWLRLLGKYSYALYLFHPLLKTRIDRLLHYESFEQLIGLRLFSVIAYLVVSILCCVPFALVSWYAFERHFLRLKDWFPTEQSVELNTTVADAEPLTVHERAAGISAS